MAASQLMNLQQQQHEQNKNEKKVVDDDKTIRPWLDLPSEILDLIYSYLFDPDHIISFNSIRDQIRFRLIFKGCHQSVHCLPGNLPFLMLQKKEPVSCFNSVTTAFTFFNPITNKEIDMEKEEEEEKEVTLDRIHCSRFGWLLMSGSFSLFFYNPFIPSSTIELPHFPKFNTLLMDGMSFTAPPTSSDCIVYIHDDKGPPKQPGPGSSSSSSSSSSKVLIYRWCYGEDHWTDYHIDCQLPFRPSFENPILYKNTFYHLDKNGRLRISDPKKGGNETHIWKDLRQPKPLKKKRKQREDDDDDIRKYMAECDGELVMVFVNYSHSCISGHPVHVFELDWSRMEWVKVQSLGNKAMFICDTGSLLIKTNGGGAENKIYFPMFVEKEEGGEKIYFPFEDSNDFVNWLNRYYYGDDGSVDGLATKKRKVGVFYCLESRKYNFPSIYWKEEPNPTWVDTKFQL